MKIKMTVIVMIGLCFSIKAQTLSEKQMQNARATGYAIIASRNPNVDFSVLMVPWDGVNSLEYNANNQINSAWHAQAVVKGNYFSQNFATNFEKFFEIFEIESFITIGKATDEFKKFATDNGFVIQYRETIGGYVRK